MTQVTGDNWEHAYCIFCRSGMEEKVAANLMRQHDDLLAMPVYQEKHQSKGGVKSLVREVMLPGYVFLYSQAPQNNDRGLIRGAPNALKVLSDADGAAELYGANLEYARWVLHYSGLITCSKAIRLGSRVQITEGPLKDYEGCIREISKKNRNGKVEIPFMGQTIRVWLPFEWVEETKEEKSEQPK